MCEYCKKPEDIQFKTIMDNRLIDASLFIDRIRGHIYWRVNHFRGDKTLFSYVDINYCPMCGRKLKEADDGND